MTSPIYRDVETFGARFRVVDPASIGLERHTTATFDDHEPVFEPFVRAIRAGEVFVDVGACFGSYTMPALAKGATAIAYEPFDDGFAILTANVESNGWQSRCRVHKVALFDGTPYPAELASDIFGAHYPAEELRTTTLDEDLDEGVCVDWMKLDVEGAELGVLVGAKRTIARCLPNFVIEDHDGIDPGKPVSDYPASVRSSERIHEMLRGLGYEIAIHRWDVSRKFIWARHPSRA